MSEQISHIIMPSYAKQHSILLLLRHLFNTAAVTVVVLHQIGLLDIFSLHLMNKVIYPRLSCPHHHQRIEVAALVLSTAVKFHHVLVFLYLVFSLFVIEDEKWTPVVLVLVLEKA